MRRQILAITRKELSSYFGSPLALIFLGTFAAAILFIFFTIETFFARGIADVRPLFRWMPLLLIFLLAALTMRQWSEEQRSGTKELLLTLPVSPFSLVLGKFLAVMFMILVALALTLPLPVTVTLMGDLDWGPVIGGYLAAILLAAAYAAIGLFVSSRTDNQIVALIVTVLVGGFFFIIGSRGVTDLFGGLSELFWSLGTGSRFESIERGVIDLRDLVYYLSLTALFLMLNTISLDSTRWSPEQSAYRRRLLLTGALIGLNLVVLNLWLSQLPGLRVDITSQREYSLSRTTKDLVNNLQEPLKIRAFVSEKNHPLLAPLTPRLRDMLREYEIASDGQLEAEVIDPIDDPQVEAEINQSYGIRPLPFQVTGRNEASVINAYFDILVQYGDQNVILNFQDLIQVEPNATGGIDVSMRNLEYDLTSAVKRTIFGFQSVDTILAALDNPVRLTFFVTPASLPEDLTSSADTIDSIAREIASSSGGKLIYQSIDPDDPASGVNRQSLFERYGLQAIPVSFFSPDSFYAYLLLENGEEAQVIPPLLDLSEGEVRTAIESALKRTSSGFLKVVGLWTPPPPPQQNQQFVPTQPLINYNLIRDQLGQEYTVRSVDLSSGQTPADLDTLVVVATQDLSEEQLFAIDQFLMRGGSVTVATSGYQVSADNFTGGLRLEPAATTNLRDWLAHHGVTLSDGLVMDPQNQPFPVTVARDAGGFQIQEIQALDYPYFVDVRQDGMDSDSLIVANQTAVTVNWAAPVTLDEAENADRETAVLLRSSANSWLRTDTEILPDFDLYPELGFPVEGEQRAFPLAASLQGTFESYFAERLSPFESAPASPDAASGDVGAESPQPLGKINLSPDSSRLVVIGSSAFAEDSILNLSAQLTRESLLNNLGFLQNVVDWSVEDLDLLTIRSRGASTRVLKPMAEGEENTWEVVNYVLALVALLAIYFAWRERMRNEEPLILPPAMTELGE